MEERDGSGRSYWHGTLHRDSQAIKTKDTVIEGLVMVAPER
jgi:hypothetical protein